MDNGHGPLDASLAVIIATYVGLHIHLHNLAVVAVLETIENIHNSMHLPV